MKKFNGWENALLKRGLKILQKEMEEEIEKIEASGRNPIMTKGFVEMSLKELKEKIDRCTLKRDLK